MKKLLLIALILFACEDPASPKDCAGVENGTASIDECGTCTGGTTNLEVNYLKDECGVCGGDNSSCSDLCGVVNGDDSTCNPIGVWDVTSWLTCSYENELCSDCNDAMSNETVDRMIVHITQENFYWEVCDIEGECVESNYLSISLIENQLCISNECNIPLCPNIIYSNNGNTMTFEQRLEASCKDSDTGCPQDINESECQEAGLNWDEDSICSTIIMHRIVE